ncbi:MAG: polymer-forming cytoskeletal protein [Acidobacteria bacterium]|nr:polymer-forming cytoskeletal protein [Acidobacteriota bacterium]
MLRMNRSPKPEPHENTPKPVSSPAPAPSAAPPPAAFNSPTTLDNSGTPASQTGERPAASRAVTESEALARDIKEGIMSGFVGGSTALKGEANFKGMLRIDGRFTGQINSDKGTLIVSAGGYVEANIEVAEARINGTVHGDIKASERVEFGRTAQVHGNILTPALVIQDGAIFEGSCRMSKQQALTDKPRVSVPQKNDTANVVRPPSLQEKPVAAAVVSKTEAA